MTIAEHREDLRDALQGRAEPRGADGEYEAGAGEQRDEDLLDGPGGKTPWIPTRTMQQIRSTP